MSDEYDGTTIAALEFEIEELKLKLEPFQQAVAHISEDGKTTRSVSCNQWAMIHPERLTDLIICEEKLATSNNMTCAMLEVSEDQRDIIEIEYR